MKILITGSFGMLGQYFYKILKNNYQIYLTSKRTNRDNFANYLSIDFLNFSKENKNLIKSFVTPDLIIHCGALTNVDLCEKEKEKAFIINCESTKILIDVFKGIKIIFISSDAVFGNSEDRLEESKTNPINYYAKTKTISEEIVLQDKKNIVIRTTPIGFNYIDKSSFVDWIINSINNNKKLKMYDNVIFNPIHAEILIKNILKLIKSKKNGIWHINGEIAYTKYVFANALANEIGLDTRNIISCNYEDNLLLARRSKNQFLNCNKFIKEFNSELPDLSLNIRMLKKNYNLYEQKN